MAFIRKACIAVLFMWFCFALIINVFGLPFYFPSNIAPSNEIMLYRGETTRVASACLLALLVFRYLFELKPYHRYRLYFIMAFFSLSEG